MTIVLGSRIDYAKSFDFKQANQKIAVHVAQTKYCAPNRILGVSPTASHVFRRSDDIDKWSA